MAMKKIPKLHAIMINSIFSDCVIFHGSFRRGNNLMCHKNTLWKVDEIFPNQRLCFGRWYSIPREKPNNPGDYAVYCKHHNKTCLSTFAKTNTREISLHCN